MMNGELVYQRDLSSWKENYLGLGGSPIETTHDQTPDRLLALPA
jgi:hypothetical protein